VGVVGVVVVLVLVVVSGWLDAWWWWCPYVSMHRACEASGEHIHIQRDAPPYQPHADDNLRCREKASTTELLVLYNVDPLLRLTNTRHDTTRHDTTRHDTTRHDTTRHDTTRHDTTRDHTQQV
jgi:hypothetical protein